VRWIELVDDELGQATVLFGATTGGCGPWTRSKVNEPTKVRRPGFAQLSGGRDSIPPVRQPLIPCGDPQTQSLRCPVVVAQSSIRSSATARSSDDVDSPEPAGAPIRMTASGFLPASAAGKRTGWRSSLDPRFRRPLSIRATTTSRTAGSRFLFDGLAEPTAESVALRTDEVFANLPADGRPACGRDHARDLPRTRVFGPRSNSCCASHARNPPLRFPYAPLQAPPRACVPTPLVPLTLEIPRFRFR
jgi:hypothetical protein